jgi:hypothetical protein
MRRSLGSWNGYFYDNEGVHLKGTSMMTFILVPAEGEHNFKADVWSLRGRHTIAVSLLKGKDDVIQIKFKISFPSGIWDPITYSFNGHFDPERDALTGAFSNKFDTGEMEFRRIPPCYLAAYPSIKEIRDDKPRALWRFAISAVLNEIRRNYWAWSYFSQRRNDRETIVPLLVRDRWFGVPLSYEENGMLDSIAVRLMPGDACFYDSKVDLIRAHTCIHE